jgi:hypothetical protein
MHIMFFLVCEVFLKSTRQHQFRHMSPIE